MYIILRLVCRLTILSPDDIYRPRRYFRASSPQKLAGCGVPGALPRRNLEEFLEVVPKKHKERSYERLFLSPSRCVQSASTGGRKCKKESCRNPASVLPR